MEKLLNTNELAHALGRCRGYVAAMKKAGYQFSHGMLTTVDHAYDWLNEHPHFRSTRYFLGGSKPDVSPDLNVAGKCDEQ